jgi:TolB-like protein/Tfp pilus assembly protein PilF
MNISNFIQELKRRNVFKVATAYAIAGWLIIQIATSVFPAFDFPQWTTQFVIILVAIGFPISIIIAWAFELTPDGLKKSKEVEITESVTASTGKKLNGIIISVLAVALFFVVIERVFFAKTSILENEESLANIETASIAVLPFVDLSPNGDQEYFSDGLSEELLNVLAKVEKMRVAGRTSSFKFKGLNEDLKIIGEQLGVAHILEGSVRKSGNRIRITAQLIKVSDGFHMWSENYDREYTTDNIFDIQDEISQQVLKELKIRLLASEVLITEARPTENIDAYNAFLEASQLVVAKTPNGLEQAIRKYTEAIELDPNFAEAYARLAIAYRLLNSYGDFPLDETKTRMRKNIDKALLLDGNLGRAYHALGRYYLLTNENESSLQSYEKAVELLPNDGDVLDGYHLALERNDRYEEGKVVQKKAYDIDPLNPAYASHYANHISSEEPEEAVRVLDKVIEMYPEYSDAYSSKAHIILGPPFGKIGEAFELAYTIYAKNPDNIGLLQSLYSIAEDLNMKEYAEFLAKKAPEIAPNNLFVVQGEIVTAFNNKDYEKVQNLLAKYKERLPGNIDLYYLMIIQFYNGNYEEAKVYFEKLNPAVTESELAIENIGDAWMATEYSVLLSKLDETEKVNEIQRTVCAFYDSMDDNASKAIDILWVGMLCDYFTDKETSFDKFEETYFAFNDKLHIPSNLETMFMFVAEKKNPSFLAMKDRIYNDLEKETNTAIASLKEKGIWMNEYSIEDN